VCHVPSCPSLRHAAAPVRARRRPRWSRSTLTSTTATSRELVRTGAGGAAAAASAAAAAHLHVSVNRGSYGRPHCRRGRMNSRSPRLPVGHPADVRVRQPRPVRDPRRCVPTCCWFAPHQRAGAYSRVLPANLSSAPVPTTDLKLHLASTDYGNFLANEPSPLATTTIAEVRARTATRTGRQARLTSPAQLSLARRSCAIRRNARRSWSMSSITSAPTPWSRWPPSWTTSRTLRRETRARHFYRAAVADRCIPASTLCRGPIGTRT